MYYDILQELISVLHTGAVAISSGKMSQSTPTSDVSTTLSAESNQINSLLELARCTVVVTLSELGTAVLLNNAFGLLPANYLNSTFEHFIKWERIIRSTNVSSDTAIVPFALYEVSNCNCIRLCS